MQHINPYLQSCLRQCRPLSDTARSSSFNFLSFSVFCFFSVPQWPALAMQDASHQVWPRAMVRRTMRMFADVLLGGCEVAPPLGDLSCLFPANPLSVQPPFGLTARRYLPVVVDDSGLRRPKPRKITCATGSIVRNGRFSNFNAALISYNFPGSPLLLGIAPVETLTCVLEARSGAASCKIAWRRLPSSLMMVHSSAKHSKTDHPRIQPPLLPPAPRLTLHPMVQLSMTSVG